MGQCNATLKNKKIVLRHLKLFYSFFLVKTCLLNAKNLTEVEHNSEKSEQTDLDFLIVFMILFLNWNSPTPQLREEEISRFLSWAEDKPGCKAAEVGHHIKYSLLVS